MDEIFRTGFVTAERIEGVGVLTLNRPPQNRLIRSMFAELDAGARRFVEEGCRAVMFRGDGPDFSLGGDFRTWAELDTHHKRRERFLFSNAVLNMIESLPVPTISCIHGRAYGGGFELALHTDLIIAAQSASFRFSEATIGVMPLAGGVQRIAERAGRAFAARIVMLSEEITAEEALRANIVAKMFPDETHAAQCLEIAKSLADGPTRAHGLTKSLLAAWSVGGVRLADEAMVENNATILVTEDAKRGIASATTAFEKGAARPPVDWTGQ